jgi:hypothetical protein
MDYAFDPRSTRYDKVIRTMFSYRPNTTVVQGPGLNTVEDFFNNLANNVSTPLTNVLLGSHGNEAAQMALEFVDGFGYTSYEALEFAINGVIKRQCQLVDKIINPRPQDSSHQPIPAFVFIKGCRIGIAVPFLQKMKEVINGLSTTQIGVSAPKFFYELYSKTPQGIFECFLYDFHAYMNKPFTTKADLIAELKKPKYGYKDIYGTSITDNQWNGWIPRNIRKTIDPLLNLTLNPSPVNNFPSLKAGRYKYEITSILTWKVDSSVPNSSLPKNKAAIPAFLKQQLKDTAANPPIDDDFAPTLQDTHPFPFFKRNGYNSIDELVDGNDWVPSHANRWFKSQRHEYSVSPPLIKNNNNNELIFNFYAAPGGGATSSNMFTDTDPKYFQVV